MEENDSPDGGFSLHLLLIVIFSFRIIKYFFIFSRYHKHIHRLDYQIGCYLWLQYKLSYKFVRTLTSVTLSRDVHLGAHLCTLIIAGYMPPPP